MEGTDTVDGAAITRSGRYSGSGKHTGSGHHTESGRHQEALYGSLELSKSNGAHDDTDGERQPLCDSGGFNSGEQGCCGTTFFVYCSHFMSAWGARMWSFAVGLFLVAINPQSLQLTAVYGLTQGACVLLLGPLLGDWVDNTPRYRAAQVTLFLQNLLIIVCAILFYFFIEYRDDFLSVGLWMEYICYGLIIIISSAANLAAIANTIAVERDWIVEICGRHEDRLATMTATMKAIDQLTLIIAPIATGAIIAFAGDTVGALFIAAWNAASFVVEYFLLWKVYNTVPALRKKKDLRKVEAKAPVPPGKEGEPASKEYTSFTASSETPPRKSCCSRVFSRLAIIVTGWRTYASYPVWLSGLALAMLFMTVLGFDNVTIGYAQLQGLDGSVLGIMQGGGGAFGILGTILFPRLRRKLGLPRTGMVGMVMLVISLSACVVALWLPGSPFELTGFSQTDLTNCTAPASNSSASESAIAGGGANPCVATPLISIYVLMSGIIVARAGLWLSDLSITQMFMETVASQERGVVNGVQSSLNQLMNFIKFALVTALPLAPQFGILVLLSWASICTGAVMHAVFLCRLDPGLFSRGSAVYAKV